VGDEDARATENGTKEPEPGRGLETVVTGVHV